MAASQQPGRGGDRRSSPSPVVSAHLCLHRTQSTGFRECVGRKTRGGSGESLPSATCSHRLGVASPGDLRAIPASVEPKENMLGTDSHQAQGKPPGSRWRCTGWDLLLAPGGGSPCPARPVGKTRVCCCTGAQAMWRCSLLFLYQKSQSAVQGAVLTRQT